LAFDSQLPTKEPDSKKLSIIIVTWNCRVHISNCLESLQRLRLENFETIIVDNHSTDGTSEFLSEIDTETRNKLGLKVLFQNFNGGLSQATDLAVRVSSGKWLLSCNPDIIFNEDLKKMLEYAQLHDFPILAPQLITIDGTPQYCMRRFTFTRLFFNLTRLGRILGRIFAQDFFGRDLYYNYESFLKPVLVEHPVASFFMINRDAVRQLGFLFSLDLPIYFGDTDLFSRAQTQKMRMVFLPAIKVTHRIGYAGTILHPEVQQFMFTNSMIRYASKWASFPRMLTLLVVVDAILAPLSHARLPSKVEILCSAFRLKGAILTDFSQSGPIGLHSEEPK